MSTRAQLSGHTEFVRKDCKALNRAPVTKHNFDTVGDMLRDVRKLAGTAYDRLPRPDRWASDHGTLEPTVNYLLAGASEAETRPARELFDKIDASFRDRDASAWMPSVAGAYPVVGDYMMGLPESMRARRPVESDQAPIRVYIEPVISAGVQDRELTRRAAALAALVGRMAEERPVELIMFASLQHTEGGWGSGVNALITAKLDTAPVSLAHIVAAFGKDMARGVLFTISAAVAEQADRHPSWGICFPNKPERMALLRWLLGAKPQDIVIQGGYLPDAPLMDRDPVEWVHRQLEKQRTLDSAA